MSLADLPTTNLRIVVSLALAVIYVIAVLVLLAIKAPVPVEVIWGLGAFILTMLGIDVAQFAAKRKTFIPAPDAPAP